MVPKQSAALKYLMGQSPNVRRIPLRFFLNLYLQQILGLSALASGLALLPMTVTIMVVMVGFSGHLIDRFGPKNT